METFGEEISAEACSGKEIAGLLRKIMIKGPNGRNDSTPFSAVFVSRLLFSSPVEECLQQGNSN